MWTASHGAPRLVRLQPSPGRSSRSGAFSKRGSMMSGVHEQSVKTAAPPVWTDETFEIVRRLWAEGWSASRIGDVVRMSRNAVLAKLRRSGVVTRDMPPQPQRPARVVIGRRPRPSTLPKPRPPSGWEDGPGIGLMDIGRCQCRWPLGPLNRTSEKFCGRRTTPGAPYCDGHMAQAYAVRTA